MRALSAILLASIWCLALALLLAGAQARYGRHGRVLLPDHAITPGATLRVSKGTVCEKRYASGARNVTDSEKRQVYQEYGATEKSGVCCEVDHLISLELGGSNDIANLWPQPYEPRPGAHEKDALEDKLHAMVCRGDISLPDAQKAIRTDWYAAYEKYVK